jgi:hypothetical protein
MIRNLRLLGFFLLGVVLVAVPIISYAAVSTSTAVGAYTGNLTPAGVLAYYATGTGATRGTEVSQPGKLTLSGGAAASKADVVIKEKVLAKTVGKALVGAARKTLAGYVAAEAVGVLLEREHMACDITGCWSTQTYPAEDIAATLVPGASTPATLTTTTSPSYWTKYGGGNCSAYQNFQSSKACGDAVAGAAWVGSYSGTTVSGTIRFQNYGGTAVQVWTTPVCPSGSTAQAGASGPQCTLTTAVYTCPVGETLSGTNCIAASTYACPATGGYTASGTGAAMRCTRPACTGATVRDAATGSCVSNAIADAAVEDALAANMTNDELNEFTRQLWEKEVAFAHDELPTITGPASVVTPDKVTTESVTSGGVTTTNTTNNHTTYNISYSQNTVTYNAVNSSVTKNAAGETIKSTAETIDEKDIEPAVTDTDLPEQPKLYERKYPNGLQGVWNDQKTALMATPLASLQSVFAPSIAGGSCPSWTFNANIGPNMNYGTGVISPPCWLWTALKAIVIVSALFVARGLVFGG